MQLPRNKIESALKKKGFFEDTSKHHSYYHHEYKGKRTGVYTYTSHGSSSHKEYGIPLLKKMKEQLKLDDIQQLDALIKCPIDEKKYNEILHEKGLIE